ncbi:hypothetical protein GGI35DRAFT_454965 [Trichoderma velutinum]
MSQATSFTNENSTPVEKKRNWKARIVSSVIGGVVVLLSFFAISALTPPGEACFIALTTVWGVSTTVADNIVGSERVTYILRQDLIQQSYRKTIEKYIGSTLENAVTSIRTQNPVKFKKRFYFDVDHEIRFAVREKRRLLLDLSYKVIAPSGASPRPLDRGVSAPDLPKYDHQSTRTVITEAKSFAEGIRHGTQDGALLGLASGALAILLCLVFGKACGIFLGIIGATILVARKDHSATPLATPDKPALTGEFGEEAWQQMMRLMLCATENSVGFEFDMQVWSTAVETEDMHPKIGESSIILHFNQTVPLTVKEGEQDGSSIQGAVHMGTGAKIKRGGDQRFILQE